MNIYEKWVPLTAVQMVDVGFSRLANLADLSDLNKSEIKKQF